MMSSAYLTQMMNSQHYSMISLVIAPFWTRDLLSLSAKITAQEVGYSLFSQLVLLSKLLISVQAFGIIGGGAVLAAVGAVGALSTLGALPSVVGLGALG